MLRIIRESNAIYNRNTIENKTSQFSIIIMKRIDSSTLFFNFDLAALLFVRNVHMASERSLEVVAKRNRNSQLELSDEQNYSNRLIDENANEKR